MSRRTLEGRDRFGEISPEVGAIDGVALAEALDEDPDETLSLVADLTGATDEALRHLARRLAGRLFLDLAAHHVPDRPGVGRIVSSPYRPDVGDLDIDRSVDGIVEARAGRRLVEPDELRVHRWARPSTAWCLLVDRSGSMNGRPVATAAMAAAALAARSPSHYAVLSFGRDVVAAKAMWETRAADDVIDRVLALRGHGTTDVARALWAAADQLRRASAQRRVAVLLSDCRSTEPGDAAAAARSLDELVIIAPDGDSVEAAELAGEAGARWTTVAGPTSVPAAFATVLDR